MERRGPTFGTIMTKSPIESMNFDVKLNRMAAGTFSIPRSPECTSVSLYLDSLIFKERNVEEEKITDNGPWFVVGNRRGGLMHDALPRFWFQHRLPQGLVLRIIQPTHVVKRVP